MKQKGIIFDFNGTLFFDSEKQEKAWKETSLLLRGKELDDEELKTKVHGRVNQSILEYLLQKPLSSAEMEPYVEQKEALYRSFCLKDSEHLKLVEGASELLDFLKAEKIPFAIATSSEKTNVHFYAEQFHLDRWFSPDHIIYDDGTIQGKPHPDIYLKACARLSLSPRECIVVEDAYSGIESAFRAGIGKIIAIGSPSSHSLLSAQKGVSETISNFHDFNRDWLIAK